MLAVFTVALFLAITPAAANAGCIEEAEGPITKNKQGKKMNNTANTEQSQPQPSAQVGKKAPNFEAVAFHQGKFKKVKLSDYKGKWVLLCFYPGDFTFV